jgi:hypothetical protein
MKKDYRKLISARLRCFKELKGCASCGYNKDGFALDFAHTNPKNKSVEITKSGPCGSGMGKMIGRLTFGKNKRLNVQRRKELFEEIRKCIILCKNCHVIETYKNKEMHNSYNTFIERKLIKEPIATLDMFF